MTKRIVSGIFILTALGALGVILAGALTSGEQLIVRFLTAVIVAALGLYVISDLRLQADDDARSGRPAGQNRVGKVDAPPNSTAAFMATVTKKVGPRNHDQALSETGGPLQLGENPVPEPANRQERAIAEQKIDAPQTTVVSAETLGAVKSGQDTPAKKVMPITAASKKAENVQPVTPVVQKPKTPQLPSAPVATGPDGVNSSIPASAETVVTSKSEFFTTGHAMAGVGAVASSVSNNSDSQGGDGDSPTTPDGSGTTHGDFLSSQSIDISDLFVDEGAKANLANGNHITDSNGLDSNGGDSNSADSDLLESDGGEPDGGESEENELNGSNGHGASNGHRHTNGKSVSNGSANMSNGGGSNGGVSNGASPDAKNGYWADEHISGRLSDTKGLDQSSFDDASTPFDPAERVYDLEGLDAAAVTGEPGTTAGTEFEYSDDLHSGDHVWPAAPANSAPEPHPFEKASAAYEAAKRKLAEAESDSADVNIFSAGSELEPVADDAPLAPIIDLRGLADPGESDVDAAINAGEVEVIATLIEQGMLATSGPISDREVRTMVYVAFTSNELRKLLLAGGSPDGPNYGLDLGPVELFDERIHTPAPKRLYSGTETPQQKSQIG